MVKDYYKNLFTIKYTWSKWRQTDITFPKLNDTQIHKLRNLINDAKINRAMFSRKPWKALGPEGFSVGFYQKSWDIVGQNVCKFVHGIWNKLRDITTINQTDICLIPKRDHLEYVTYFRPISLCNLLYKVIIKIIVERLKGFMPKLVSLYHA